MKRRDTRDNATDRRQCGIGKVSSVGEGAVAMLQQG